MSATVYAWEEHLGLGCIFGIFLWAKIDILIRLSFLGLHHAGVFVRPLADNGFAFGGALNWRVESVTIDEWRLAILVAAQVASEREWAVG